MKRLSIKGICVLLAALNLALFVTWHYSTRGIRTPEEAVALMEKYDDSTWPKDDQRNTYDAERCVFGHYWMIRYIRSDSAMDTDFRFISFISRQDGRIITIDQSCHWTILAWLSGVDLKS